MVTKRSRLLSAGLPLALLAGLLSLPVPVSAQVESAYLNGAEPWTESDCAGDVPIVVGSDAKAQSDIYSAITLAGVVGTDCVILAGPRDSAMPAAQRERLGDATAGGYVVGGTAALPTAKLDGRNMTRIGGATRWQTAQLIGNAAREAAGIGAPDTTTAPSTPLDAPTDVQEPGVFLSGAEPWTASDCAGHTPIVVGADAKAQSDIYSAITLAGAVGTYCVILAGPRDGAMPASQQARLKAAAAGGYVVGGIAAVPTAKLNSRAMTRLAGDDRWATAQLVGRRASGDTTAGTSTADEPTDKAEESASGRYTAVTAGGAHTCGLRDDGTITCWGDNSRRQAEAPSGIFTALSAGGAHTCALRDDGTIACWGDSRYRRTDAPSGTFTALSAGPNATCALRSSGAVACWGESHYADADVPGTFTAVSAGYWHACGLRDNGTITCWGNRRYGRDDVPSGTFTALSVDNAHRCGLRDNGTIACWGPSAARYADALPSGRLTAVSAGNMHACGLRDNATITCWGDDRWGRANAPAGKFSAVSVGSLHACGLRDNATITCWGPNGAGQTEMAQSTAESADGRILRSSVFACGVLSNGTTDCQWWGPQLPGIGVVSLGVPDTPPGDYVSLVSQSDVDDRFMCLLRSDGSVACWAPERGWFTPPAGPYENLHRATDAGICGLRTDRTVACWDLSGNWSTPPAGTLESLHQTNGRGICGWHPDRSVTCWDRRSTWGTPDGQFAYLGPSAPGSAVGWRYSNCGLRTDGTAECWPPHPNWSGPPGGRFASLLHDSVGDRYCGLRPDGTAACWGSSANRFEAPTGQFASLRVFDNDVACGLRADGTVVCWGGAGVEKTWTPTHRVEFESLVPLYNNMCGLRPDKTAVCWHSDQTWPATPSGQFACLVPIASFAVCGSRVDGRFVCWEFDEATAPTSHRFRSVQIETGFATWCGLRTDRTVACSFDPRRTSTPRGTFASLIAGDSFFRWCGLRTDGTVACWSASAVQQTPSGTFESLHTFSNSVCALRADQTLACWEHGGETADYHSLHRVPTGPLAAVALDESFRGCVLGTNGRLHCWED